jgi:hypothetical protein
MKYCKDCRFAEPRLYANQTIADAKCLRPTGSVNPVSAEPETVRRLCEVERKNEHPDSCGPTAKFYKVRLK